MKIAITGATGFIGTYLSKRLESQDVKVIKLNQEMYKNIHSHLDLIADCSLLIHLGSSSSVDRSFERPEIDIEDNLLPFLKFLEILPQTKIKRIIFASSGGTIYGKNQNLCSEETLPKPFSPYAIGKLAIEGYLEYAKIRHGIIYDLLRISNPYGPFLQPKSVIGIWLNAIKNQKPLMLFGNGTDVKDYIYIEDLIDLMIAVINRKTQSCETYNLASGQTHTLLEISEAIEKVTSQKISFEKYPLKLSDNSYFKLENKKVLTLLENKNFTSLEAGIKLTWNSLR